MNINSISELLRALTGITPLEAGFIVTTANDLRIFFDDLELEPAMGCNGIIASIYELAIKEAGIQAERVDMDVNSTASRLKIDGDLISSYKELQDRKQDEESEEEEE